MPRVCRHWKRGNCWYGKLCRFSHSHSSSSICGQSNNFRSGVKNFRSDPKPVKRKDPYDIDIKDVQDKLFRCIKLKNIGILDEYKIDTDMNDINEEKFNDLASKNNKFVMSYLLWPYRDDSIHDMKQLLADYTPFSYISVSYILDYLFYDHTVKYFKNINVIALDYNELARYKHSNVDVDVFTQWLKRILYLNKYDNITFTDKSNKTAKILEENFSLGDLVMVLDIKLRNPKYSEAQVINVFEDDSVCIKYINYGPKWNENIDKKDFNSRIKRMRDYRHLDIETHRTCEKYLLSDLSSDVVLKMKEMTELYLKGCKLCKIKKNKAAFICTIQNKELIKYILRSTAYSFKIFDDKVVDDKVLFMKWIEKLFNLNDVNIKMEEIVENYSIIFKIISSIGSPMDHKVNLNNLGPVTDTRNRFSLFKKKMMDLLGETNKIQNDILKKKKELTSIRKMSLPNDPGKRMNILINMATIEDDITVLKRKLEGVNKSINKKNKKSKNNNVDVDVAIYANLHDAKSISKVTSIDDFGVHDKIRSNKKLVDHIVDN
eukprot:538328_1